MCPVVLLAPDYTVLSTDIQIRGVKRGFRGRVFVFFIPSREGWPAGPGWVLRVSPRRNPPRRCAAPLQGGDGFRVSYRSQARPITTSDISPYPLFPLPGVRASCPRFFLPPWAGHHLARVFFSLRAGSPHSQERHRFASSSAAFTARPLSPSIPLSLSLGA